MSVVPVAGAKGQSVVIGTPIRPARGGGGACPVGTPIRFGAAGSARPRGSSGIAPPSPACGTGTHTGRHAEEFNRQVPRNLQRLDPQLQQRRGFGHRFPRELGRGHRRDRLQGRHARPGTGVRPEPHPVDPCGFLHRHEHRLEPQPPVPGPASRPGATSPSPRAFAGLSALCSPVGTTTITRTTSTSTTAYGYCRSAGCANRHHADTSHVQVHERRKPGDRRRMGSGHRGRLHQAPQGTRHAVPQSAAERARMRGCSCSSSHATAWPVCEQAPPSLAPAYRLNR